jgi:hypothetical protein
VFLTFRKKDGRTFLSLAETYSDGRRTFQRVVLDLGPRDEMTREEIRDLATALALGDPALRLYAARRTGNPGRVPAAHLARGQADLEESMAG